MDQSRAIVDVAWLVANDPRHAVSLGELDQCSTERGFRTAGVMQLHFHSESVTKNGSPPAQRVFRFTILPVAEVRCDESRERAGQYLHSFAPLGYLLPRKSRPTPRFLAVSFLPRRQLANSRPRYERGDVVEPDFVLRQKGDGTAIDIELGANNRLQPDSSRFQTKSNDAAQIGRIGYPQRTVAE